MRNEPTSQAAGGLIPWWWVPALALPAAVWVACETIWPWFSAMDCAWQEGNACVRMVRGELPGRDFQLFHGVGAAWAHLPVFLLAGGGERAVACTHYATAAMACGALAWRILGPVAAGRVRLALAAGVISVLCVLPFFRSLVDPLGNMASTRAALGALVALAVTGQGKPWPALAGCAALLGLAAACFADQAAILALTVFIWGVLRVVRERKRAALAGFAPLAGLALAPLWQWMMCGGQAGRLWEFQWEILPAAQTWFWAPTQRFFRCPADLRWLADPRLVFAVAAHAAAWVVAGAGRGGAPPALRRMQCVLVIFSLASLLPLVGYLSQHYFHAAGLTGVLALAAAGWHARDRLTNRINLKVRFWWPLAFALVFSVARERLTWSDCPYGSRQLGPALEKHRATIAGPVWSFYRGPLDYRLGNPPGPEEDLIIYAVGTRRAREYADAFRRTAPRWVHTPAGAPFNDWLAVRYWDAHRELLAAYRPVCEDGPWATWERQPGRDEASGSSDVPAQADSCGPGWELVLDVPVGAGRAGEDVLVECSLTHARSEGGSGLANLGCRWVVSPADARCGPEFSLDPSGDRTVTRFPLLGRRGERMVLRLAPHGLGPRTGLAIGPVTAATLPDSWVPGWNSLMKSRPD